MSTTIPGIRAAAAAVLIAVLAAACAPSASEPPGNAPPAGTVRVFLADSRPAPEGIVAVRVTLRGVSLLPAGRDGEISLDGGPIGVVGELQIDLSGARSAAALIAAKSVPAATYRGVRLYLASASVVDPSGSPRPLTVAPARVEVPVSLLVDPSSTLDVTLDLDAAASLGPPAAAGAAASFRPMVTVMPADARAAKP